MIIFSSTNAGAKPLSSSPPNGAVLRVFARFKPLSLRRCDVRSPVEFASGGVKNTKRASFSLFVQRRVRVCRFKSQFFLLCFCDDETF